MMMLAAALLLLPAPAAAGFALSNLFSDSMVLQAEAPTLFGTCTGGAKISVAAGGETVSAACAADGSWTARLAPKPASAPTKPGVGITVSSGGTSKTLKDVCVFSVDRQGAPCASLSKEVLLL